MRNWTREIDLDIERCHEIVTAQFLQFIGLTPILFGEGWDNICIRYEDGSLFRLPIRALAGKIIQYEIGALPFLAGKLPLAIPHLHCIGFPTDEYPYHFVGYSEVPGTTSDRMDWTTEQRLATIDGLTEFLRTLHQILVPDSLREMLPKEIYSRSNIDALLGRIQMRRDQIAESYPERTAWVSALHNLANELGEGVVGEETLVLVHGDLYPRHILAEENHVVTGIIDWGDVHICHPAADLSLAYTFYEPDERSAFWTAYGLPISDECKAFARLKAINYALSLFAYGIDINDRPITQLGETIVQRVMMDVK